jgi:putative ATP-dependent endonuclease of OLD family
LDDEDYKFLERFLDTTKADLFFAKWLIFVEWIAEALLIPIIAKALWINLNQKWISIINLNWLSFKRYINIFIKSDKTSYLGTKISVITDRDWKINTDTDKQITKEEFKILVNTWIDEVKIYKELDWIKYEWVEEVQFFYNNIKTLEFDLWIWIFFDDLLSARQKMNKTWKFKWEEDIKKEHDKYKKSFMLYEKLKSTKWDFAQELSFIWEQKDQLDFKNNLLKDDYIKYIIKALEHVTWENY